MSYPYLVNNQNYIQDLQQIKDRIDQQMRQAQQYQSQMQQTPQINQTFQLASNQNINDIQAKIIKDKNEINNTFIVSLGLFVDELYTKLWVKDTKGKIRTFNLSEEIELTEEQKENLKLKQENEESKQTIAYLSKEIEELKKGMITNAKQSVTNDANESVPNERPTRVSKSKSANA